MKGLKNLGIYKYDEIPDHMYMRKELNYSKAFNDNDNLFEFNEKENIEGENFLKKHNIDKDNYICFIVRTAEYNKLYSNSKLMIANENSVRKFFNVKEETYNLSLNYLVNKGYKVIRMGKGFSNPFPFKHKNFIDYAVSSDKNDFLDIWLSANCKFFYGTNNGIVHLPAVFNKPILGTNAFPIGSIASYLPKSIHLPRIVKKDGKFINIKEQIKLDIIRWVNGDYYKKIKVEILENTSEDILNAVKDMEMKINSGFYVDDLNINFWQNLKKNWTNENNLKYNSVIKRSFIDYHRIDGIKTTIPNFYLKKYKDVFFD